ncbi:EpsG family protein [Gallibacterium genomosp. 3]
MILVSFIEVITNKRYNFLLIFLVATVYVFFFGFRGFVGWDILNYYAQYQFGQHDNFEIGYSFIVKIAHYFQLDFHTFIAIITISQFFLLWNFLKKWSPYPILSLFICITTTSFNLQIETIRHAFCLYIYLNSIQYIRDKKLFRFSVCMIFAILFHVLGLFLFMTYFIYNYLFSRNSNNIQKVITFFIIIGFILLCFHISILSVFLNIINSINLFNGNPLIEKLNYYLSTIYFSGDEGIFSNRFLFSLIMTIPIFFCRKDLNNNDNEVFLYNFFKLSWVVYFLTIGLLVVWFRIYSLTFIFVYWLLLPIIIKKKGRNGYILLIILFCLLSYRVIHTINNYPYLRYTNILFQDDSYFERLEFKIQFDESRNLFEKKE